MTVERIIRALAGSFVLLSLALGAEASPIYHSSYWLIFTAFVGANLLQSSFTGFCLPEKLLVRLGIKQGTSCSA